MVEIEFNLMLTERMGRKRASVDIGAPEIRLGRLEELLGLTDDDVGMLFINGKWAPLDSYIPDGAFVKLFPDTEGG
jgi:hypothetical protein